MRMIASEPIGTQAICVPRSPMLHFKQQRRATIPMEHLSRIDAMPARCPTGSEQIESGGRVRSSIMPALIPKSLAEVTAFRVWPQPQVSDHFVRCERSTQNNNTLRVA